VLVSTDACASDADCVVVNSRECCRRDCESAPTAMSKTSFEHARQICAAVDCDMSQQPACTPVESASLYRAKCSAGTCAGARR
jgi:hypothetical protein